MIVKEALKDILKPKSKEEISNSIDNKDWSSFAKMIVPMIMRQFPKFNLKEDTFYDRLLFSLKHNLIGELVIGKGASKDKITLNTINSENYHLSYVGKVESLSQLQEYIKIYN